MSKKIKIGDKVLVIGVQDGNSRLLNKIGTVCAIDREGSSKEIGVKFDFEFERGHNLEGRINTFSGWWFNPFKLKIVKSRRKRVKKYGIVKFWTRCGMFRVRRKNGRVTKRLCI